MSNATNHEFLSWVVKGYIGQMKGYNVNWVQILSWVVKGYIGQLKGYNVNWVQTATSTAKEKAHRLGVENLKNN
jgi:hypothetical protein